MEILGYGRFDFESSSFGFAYDDTYRGIAGGLFLDARATQKEQEDLSRVMEDLSIKRLNKNNSCYSHRKSI